MNPFSDYPCSEVKAAWLAKVAAMTVMEDPEVAAAARSPALIEAITGEAEKKAKGIISEAETKAEAFRKKTIVGSLVVGALLLSAGKIF
jgi:vacuolar-type H+-ATPase subunit H